MNDFTVCSVNLRLFAIDCESLVSPFRRIFETLQVNMHRNRTYQKVCFIIPDQNSAYCPHSPIRKTKKSNQTIPWFLLAKLRIYFLPMRSYKLDARDNQSEMVFCLLMRIYFFAMIAICNCITTTVQEKKIYFEIERIQKMSRETES